MVSGDVWRAIDGSVVDDDDLDASAAGVGSVDASEAHLQPCGVVPHGHDECDLSTHDRVTPIVQSGLTPEGSTLKSLYMTGMLVNIRITNASAQITRYAKKP